MTQTILRIDASARREGSVSRAFADAVLARTHGAKVVRRDLADGIPMIDAAFASGTFKSAQERSAQERLALATSDELLAELQSADTLLIATPTYNFTIPASLKAWIDQVARAGLAFRYTKDGPEGLLTGKRALVLRASGGTPTGSAADFATPYLKFALGFIGITDVTFLDAPAEPGEEDLERAAQMLAPRLAA